MRSRAVALCITAGLLLAPGVFAGKDPDKAWKKQANTQEKARSKALKQQAKQERKMAKDLEKQRRKDARTINKDRHI